MIAAKYRYLHPSMLGKIDINVSSNSDPGMSGSLVPFVKTYDGLFFSPEQDPCSAEYEHMKALHEFIIEDREILKQYPEMADSLVYEIPEEALATLEAFTAYMYEHREKFKELLDYEPIGIHEKED